MDPAILELAMKMAATAAVVVVACLLVERAGPLVGGLIATMPISAGPGFFFLAMEHDAAFIGASAAGGVRALTATIVFVSIYALIAPKAGLLPGLGGALVAWFAIAAAPRPGNIFVDAGIFVGAFAVCFGLTRAARAFRPALRGRSSVWDIPVRAAGAMVLVAVVLALGRLFGPAAAGIAALAPIVMTSLALLLYPRLGAAGAASVLANALPGMFGNAIAVVVLNRTAVGLGSGVALLVALGICGVWNLGLLGVSRMGKMA